MSSEATAAGGGVGVEGPAAPRQDANGPPSPGLDIHEVLGLPRPKRQSERSEEEEEIEEVDSDEDDDSDDDTEEWQEGEYLVMEDDDEELKELQVQMMSESASLSRDILVPIFTACTSAYKQWIGENQTSLSDEELNERRTQLELYRKVLELYGSDAEWEGLTHAKRVNRNKEAHETSLRAKELGPPPDAVSLTSVTSEKKMAEATLSPEHLERRIEDRMKTLQV